MSPRKNVKQNLVFGGESVGFREARIKAGLSVSQVMKEVGVSDAAVYYWETGQTRPTAKRLMQIAKLYHCSVEELLDGEPESKVSGG